MKAEVLHKITRAMCMCFALAVAHAFAGNAADTLITFSTCGAGPDRYADGEAVMDGECYALVWSKDGVFEGLQADGVPVDANDKVVLVAPKVGGSGFYKVIRN